MKNPITIDRRAMLAGLGGGAAWIASPARADSADDKREAEHLVDEAKYSAQNLAGAPELGWVRDNIGRTKGILIVPSLVKGGFIVGGSGGDGVLVGRDLKSGIWSYPAFYTLGSVTFGLQIGGQVSEVILLIMTDRGLDALMTTDVKLGGDISVAAGPVGVGAKAATADVLSFSRSKGLYGGITVEGAVVATRRALNEAYYGQRASSMDIIVRRNASSAHAEGLRKAVAAIGH